MAHRYGKLPDELAAVGFHRFERYLEAYHRNAADEFRTNLLPAAYHAWLTAPQKRKQSFDKFARKLGLLQSPESSEPPALRKNKAAAAIRRAEKIRAADKRTRGQ